MAAPTESWMIDSPTPEPDNVCERRVSVLTSLHSITVGLETFIIRISWSAGLDNMGNGGGEDRKPLLNYDLLP